MYRGPPTAIPFRASSFSTDQQQTGRLNISGNILTRSLLQALALFRRGGWMAVPPAEEPPLRSELFSADQMEQHGKALAASHLPGARRTRDLLLARLAENEALLLEACDLLTAAIRDSRPGTPAGEWLLDNFHLIEEQIRTARRHLPRDYSRELPRLANGPSAGLPRVYDIALETISHGDGQVDPESFGRFIAAYQTVTHADARRAVGGADHAAPGADREPAPRRQPHHRASHGPRPGRFLGRAR